MLPGLCGLTFPIVPQQGRFALMNTTSFLCRSSVGSFLFVCGSYHWSTLDYLREVDDPVFYLQQIIYLLYFLKLSLLKVRIKLLLVVNEYRYTEEWQEWMKGIKPICPCCHSVNWRGQLRRIPHGCCVELSWSTGQSSGSSKMKGQIQPNVNLQNVVT